MIRPISAKYLISSPSVSLAPDFGTSEVVFLGRSNVGKSSLINALANHKGLAKSSSTPGKTQLINFFDVGFEQNKDDEINKFSLIFVDLPGFGYAKVSKTTHSQWEKNLDEFLKLRQNIRLFIHLIDARHYDLDIDLSLGEYLKSFVRADQKILNIYTKSDKLNQSQKSALLKFDPGAVLVSTLKKVGIKKANETIVGLALGQIN